MLHGRKEVSFVSIIMFILRPDALSLNGSVMINQSITAEASRFRPDEANNPLDGVSFCNSWIVFSSALDDIKERVSLAAHAGIVVVIVVDSSSNANES